MSLPELVMCLKLGLRIDSIVSRSPAAIAANQRACTSRTPAHGDRSGPAAGIGAPVGAAAHVSAVLAGGAKIATAEANVSTGATVAARRIQCPTLRLISSRPCR